MSPTPGRRPHILVSNDDGIGAEGLRALCDALSPLGELTIIAPSAERSGMGHGISFLKDMELKQVEREGSAWGWALDGTPADCVKVGLQHVVDRPVDIVVSGINRGQNAGTNVHYSGTIGAAREGALSGLPAVAVSLYYHDPEYLPYATAARVGAEVTARVLQQGLPPGTLLNVNVPPLPYEELKGWAITRMGTASYKDKFMVREEAAGELVKARVAQSGLFRNVGDRWQLSADGQAINDDCALELGMVAITPLQCDQTAHAHMAELASMLLPGAETRTP